MWLLWNGNFGFLKNSKFERMYHLCLLYYHRRNLNQPCCRKDPRQNHRQLEKRLERVFEEVLLDSSGTAVWLLKLSLVNAVITHAKTGTDNTNGNHT